MSLKTYMWLSLPLRECWFFRHTSFYQNLSIVNVENGSSPRYIILELKYNAMLCGFPDPSRFY